MFYPQNFLISNYTRKIIEVIKYNFSNDLPNLRSRKQYIVKPRHEQ